MIQVLYFHYKVKPSGRSKPVSYIWRQWVFLCGFCVLPIVKQPAAGFADANGWAAGNREPGLSIQHISLDSRLDRAFQLVRYTVETGEIPGAIALVAREGRIVRQEAFGMCDPERGIPFRTNTICWIASVTKPVTVATAMTLVDEGKLSLDDPVERWLPEFKSQVDSNGNHHVITIKHLMTHTSGIVSEPPMRRPGPFIGGPLFDDWLTRDLPDIVSAAAKSRLLFAPGSRVRYSNTAMFVLGRVMEVVTGRSYAQLVQERILEPLHMNDTWYAPPAADSGRVSAIYGRIQDKLTRVFRFNPHLHITNAAPDGGLFSYPAEMMKFLQMFLDNDGSVLSKSAVQAMLTEQYPGWGLGWSLETNGGFFHGGSSGTRVFADPHSKTIGILFFQFGLPRSRVWEIQAEFQRRVLDANTPDAQDSGVQLHDVFELPLTATMAYANPFRDVQVSAEFTAPSGRTISAAAFYDGGSTWKVRIAPDETGPWTWRIRANTTADAGLIGRTGGFVCLPSSRKGFIRVDPESPYWFSYGNGHRFWGLGDTCYGLVSGLLDKQRRLYLDTRAAQGFNFVRFHATGYPFGRWKGADNQSPWPWGGTPEAPDYDRLNPLFFQRLDGIVEEFSARGLHVELLLLNYYSKPFTDPAVWTIDRQNLYLRYLVARLSAFSAVFLWTVANEYEIYPDGNYRDLKNTPESDHRWAIETAATIRNADPHHHPVTVHPTYAFDQEYYPCERGEIGRRFGNAPEIEVLTHQVNSYASAIFHPEPPGFWDGLAGEVSQAMLLDRRFGKPVVNTESGYEWLKDYPTSYTRQSHATDKCRRSAWRVFMSGGAAYAAGFSGTWPGVHNNRWRNWQTRQEDGPLPFTMSDMGLAAQLGHLKDFVSRTDFRKTAPATELVGELNLCLAVDGREYIVYAPEGGNISLDLQRISGNFSVEWFNPRTGQTTGMASAPGGVEHTFQSPDTDDWVLHLKRMP